MADLERPLPRGELDDACMPRGDDEVREVLPSRLMSRVELLRLLGLAALV